ncbi:MAG: IPT/TIG domain-containing protein [Acidobacteriota bacterium]
MGSKKKRVPILALLALGGLLWAFSSGATPGPGPIPYAPAVTVTSIAPTSGPSSGGTTVSIGGTGFENGATVSLGGAAATGVVVASATLIQATTGSHAAGTVSVTVTNPDATAGTLPGGFTYTGSLPPPSVSQVQPSSGSTAGGTPVTISGANFVSGATVTFGGSAATLVSLVSASSLTCLTPSHAAGAVDVVVTNPDSQSATLASGYSYTASNPPPSISGLTPSSGSTAGGTPVTISGANFVSGATVTFGGSAATLVSLVSASSLTCLTPSHAAGVVDVVVTNPDSQSATLASGYSYTASNPPPSISGLTPSSGSTAGGTPVMISGSNFVAGATVTFGGAAATQVSLVSASSLTCLTPSHGTGAVDVMVQNPDSQSGTLPGGFTFVAPGNPPTVSGVSPSSGPAAGGTAVTISGSNFVAGASVTLGGAAAPGVTVVSAGSITATTPAHAAGTVDVVVTNPDQQSGTLPGGFTFTGTSPAPTVTSVNPASGPTTGGTAVVISGTNFLAGASVFFGGTPASGVAVGSANSITAVSPPHAAGAVDVAVTNPDNQSGLLPAGYTYQAQGCTLSCSASVSNWGQVGSGLSFQASADTGNCTGAPSYQWDFGDGGVSNEASAVHAYTAPGTYSWALTLSWGGQTCQQFGSILVVLPPIITYVQKAGNPFRLKVFGTNFHASCTVLIDGAPVPAIKWKGNGQVIAKKGGPLKAMVPKGTVVQVTIRNEDDHGVSAPFAFSR